jgi:dTDP-4-amino-4,6-dideoxygalactose transaminase
MTALLKIARRHDLAVVEDACQAHLATCEGKPVGTLGIAGAFSFYPTKNLGALGDGGAIVTNDEGLADLLRRLRNGGQTDRYHHAELGVNSRLDEIQAAILRARLALLPEWTARRRKLAALYRQALADTAVSVPPELDPGHVYHLFPVRTADRAGLQAQLTKRQIGSLIHYPVPIPRQPAFAAFASTPCPVADAACAEVCSLPLYPNLKDEDVEAVAAEIRAWRPTAQPAPQSS